MLAIRLFLGSNIPSQLAATEDSDFLVDAIHKSRKLPVFFDWGKLLLCLNSRILGLCLHSPARIEFKVIRFR